MKRFRAASLIGWATACVMTASPALAQKGQCLTEGEAQSVASVFAPSAVRAVRTQCASRLGADSYLNRSGDRLVAKLQAGAQGQLTNAMRGVIRLVGRDSQIDLSSLPPEMVQPLIDPLVQAKLGTANIDAQGCRRIDRALSLIDPLPARNISGLLVMILQFDLDNRAQAKQSAGANRPLFKICEGPEN